MWSKKIAMIGEKGTCKANADGTGFKNEKNRQKKFGSSAEEQVGIKSIDAGC